MTDQTTKEIGCADRISANNYDFGGIILSTIALLAAGIIITILIVLTINLWRDLWRYK